MSATKKQIGELPPRYSFILNPYLNERLSSCPRCRKLTHARKFPLLIHVASWGWLTLGKTCVYCSQCELIIVHQHELEAELVHTFEKAAPEVIGNDYLVLGTVLPKAWKAGLTGAGPNLKEALKHVAEFKQVLKLEVDPGGWRPATPSKERERR